MRLHGNLLGDFWEFLTICEKDKTNSFFSHFFHLKADEIFGTTAAMEQWGDKKQAKASMQRTRKERIYILGNISKWLPVLISVKWKWKSLIHVQLFATPWNSPGQRTGVCSLSLLQRSSQPRDWTQVFFTFCMFFTLWAYSLPAEPPGNFC